MDLPHDRSGSQETHPEERESRHQFWLFESNPTPPRYWENTSQYGIYFITEKKLTVGSIVSIQPWRCGTRPPETSPAYSRREADAVCAETHNASHQLNALVIGKVMHCRRLENHLPPAYGVGAHYESPSV